MVEAALAVWLWIAPGRPLLPAECAVDPAVPALGFLAAANAERQARGLAPLALDGALCAVAGERARALVAARTLDESQEAVAEIGLALRQRGYRFHTFRQRAIESVGEHAAVLAAWRRFDAPGFAEVMLGDVADLGVGRAELDGTPLWVLMAALPAHTVFLREAAALGSVEQVRAAVLGAMNRERERRGRRPLRLHPRLERAAQLHAEDERRRGYYAHRSPEGSTPRQRMLEQGYDARLAGENIAKGFFSPEEAVRRWMLSSDHRPQILSPRLVDVGVGWALDRSAETAWWVVDFGAGGPPP